MGRKADVVAEGDGVMYGQFGRFTKRVREKRGMAVAELAQRLSVAPKLVEEWENGQTMPDEDMLCRLADVLEVNVPELEQGQYLYADENEPIATPKKSLPAISGKTKRKRILAYLLDGVSACLVAMVLMIAAAAALTASHPDALEAATVAILYGIVYLFGLRDWLGNGRSLGKRLIGLTVCDKNTADKPAWWQLFFRHILCIDGIDLILILADGRTIGDYLFGTVVIAEYEIPFWKEQLKCTGIVKRR